MSGSSLAMGCKDLRDFVTRVLPGFFVHTRKSINTHAVLYDAERGNEIMRAKSNYALRTWIEDRLGTPGATPERLRASAAGLGLTGSLAAFRTGAAKAAAHQALDYLLECEELSGTALQVRRINGKWAIERASESGAGFDAKVIAEGEAYG